MVPRRFINSSNRRILKIGRFVVVSHLRGGLFLLSCRLGALRFVRRIDLSGGRHRVPGYTLIFFILLISSVGLMTNAGTADSVSLETLEKMESGLSPIEIEDKSERMKKIITGGPEGEVYAAARNREKIIEYTVRPGDTLSEIAGRYRVPIEMITVSSGIKLSSLIHPGQKLIVPSRPGLVYKIKKGDRLAAVAQYYSVNLDKILKENPEFESLDIIEPGARIFLPDARIPAPPPIWQRPGWGRITGYFGMRRHPILRRRRMHYGIDIAMRYSSVRAARSGHVIFAGRLGSYGKTVILEHAGGYKSLYAHLNRITVRKGRYVKARSRIGISGNTGFSTGPHLHFEIIRNGRPINPRKKIRF